MAELHLREIDYDHPDAAGLIAQVQAEYVLRYGGPDESPVDFDEFRAPAGLFCVGYLDGVPVAMGGWRRHPAEHPQTGWAAPAVEIKRMYVVPDYRGAGFARAVLARLERSAAAAGMRWVLLETGSKQPEAIALYHSAGYRSVPAFGHYADTELSVHLGKQVG
jgi:GNAT superfamily N-acetyltransferase